MTKQGSGTGTVISADGLISCGGACSASYPAGTSVTLAAALGSGATFKQWGGACGGTVTSCSITLSSNQSVTATFSESFTDGSGPNSAIAGAASVGAAGATVIKAAHVLELRTAIDNLRAGKGLGPYSWADLTLNVRSTAAKRIHFVDLRTALAAVCAAVPGTCVAYTDSMLTGGQTVIKAAHLNELRANVRALE